MTVGRQPPTSHICEVELEIAVMPKLDGPPAGYGTNSLLLAKK